MDKKIVIVGLILVAAIVGLSALWMGIASESLLGRGIAAIWGVYSLIFLGYARILTDK